MKVLLDECVPYPLARLLTGCECVTARDCGWGGFKNGDLLRVAEGKFAVFVTADKNLRYQQNLAGRQLPIIELSTNDIRRIRAAVESVQAALATVESGEYRTVEIP